MKKNKLRPCDCKDMVDCSKLDAPGIAFNNNSILVEPNVVILTLDNTTVKIPMGLFKKFAEWYLEEQVVWPYEVEEVKTTEYKVTNLYTSF